LSDKMTKALLPLVVMALIPVAELRALERARWRLGAVPGVGVADPQVAALGAAGVIRGDSRRAAIRR
jgi:hypothetical protein